jgi:hypothetical protein
MLFMNLVMTVQQESIHVCSAGIQFQSCMLYRNVVMYDLKKLNHPTSTGSQLCMFYWNSVMHILLEFNHACSAGTR